MVLINITYHSNLNDADDDLNPLDTNYIYAASMHTIIATDIITTTILQRYYHHEWRNRRTN